MHLQLVGNSHLGATAMSHGLPLSLLADFHPHITFLLEFNEWQPPCCEGSDCPPD